MSKLFNAQQMVKSPRHAVNASSKATLECAT